VIVRLAEVKKKEISYMVIFMAHLITLHLTHAPGLWVVALIYSCTHLFLGGAY
jgi:hypothetical protein